VGSDYEQRDIEKNISTSFFQFQFSNSLYQKCFVSMANKDVLWKFCTLKYFTLYVPCTYMTENDGPHILKYLMPNINKTKGTKL